MLTSTVTEFFNWWCGELSALPTRTPISSFVSCISRHGIVFGTASQETVSAASSTEHFKAEIAAKVPKGARTSLLIDSSICLERSNGARRLPATLARSSAEIDLMAATPINVDDVHVLIPQEPARAPSYFVVKKKVLEPIVLALRDAGADIVSISIQDGERVRPLDALSVRSVWPPSRREKLAQRIGQYALTASLALAVATYGFAYARYWRAGAELDERIAAVQVAAKAARSQLQARQAALSTIAKVRADKSEAVPLVAVWNELTRRLPDDVWLTDVDIAGPRVSLAGFAVSASGLVATLNASPLFEAPAFTGPVVRAPGQDGERFSLQLIVSKQ